MSNDENKVCCFTGHRPKLLRCGYNEEHSSCKQIKQLLQYEVIRLIEEYNVTTFISGMAQGVDIWAAEIIIDLKEDYPGITLEAVLPCSSQTRGWNVKYKERYDRLLKLCDKVTCLQNAYSPNCMMKRNRYMVDVSDFVIAVWNGEPSGTANTIKYAVKCRKQVICIDANNYERIELS